MSCCRSLLAALLLIPGLSFAQSHQVGENVTYGYAQVLRASPVYENVRITTPEQHCDGQPRDGGGATTGTVVGHHVDKNNGSGGTHCRTVELVREERRLAGYDVEYTYKGEKYMSRLENDPGNRLRIRVSVMPDELIAGDH